jgi:hypothetical protein
VPNVWYSVLLRQVNPIMQIDKSEYEAIASQISSDASPVGIDAKKTHVMIIHLLQQLHSRLQQLEQKVDALAAERPD